jgi:hypothetical protein
MRFCPWYPLDEATQRAPRQPGVYQVKVPAGLLDYPGGKSAMIHYGAGPDLAAALGAFASQHPGSGWLARHQADGRAAASPGALLAELLGQFERRFGSAPSLPR